MSSIPTIDKFLNEIPLTFRSDLKIAARRLIADGFTDATNLEMALRARLDADDVTTVAAVCRRCIRLNETAFRQWLESIVAENADGQPDEFLLNPFRETNALRSRLEAKHRRYQRGGPR